MESRRERGDANDTRDTIARLAQLRAQKAKLLGYPNFAAWKLEDQMAKTPEAALKFMDELVPAVHRQSCSRSQGHPGTSSTRRRAASQLQPWDWDFYAEQVRKAKYDLDESQVKPYFELNNVLQNGVFYAANQLYGITFKERHDIPVYAAGRARLRGLRRRRQFAGAVLLRLLQARQQERRRVDERASSSSRSCSAPSRWSATSPTSLRRRRASRPCSPPTTCNTMFHEFGHALHGMFADTEYPSLSGTSTARDFVEFPSQFNEHWATYPDGLPALRQALQDRRAHARRTGRQDRKVAAPSTRATTPPNCWPRPSSTCSGTPCRRRAPLQNPDAFENAGAGEDPSADQLRSAALSLQLLQPHLGAAATRPATTPICGRRCSTTMPTSGSWSTAA